jgi:hypothetical protein
LSSTVVLAVRVDVRDGQAVVALAVVALAAVGGGGGVEGPASGELAVPPVPGRDHGARVIAARHDQGGAGAVEVGRSGQEAVDAVAVVVAPGGHVAAARDIVDGPHRLAGLTVEHREELRAGQDVAAGVAVVGGRVADHGAGAVPGAVGGLHGDLGLAVAVVVVHLELRVVRAGADVAAQVHAPQPGAVQPDAVDDRVAGVAGLGVVLGVGGIPLQDQVEPAVAVQVADTGVVGLVGVRHPVRCPAAGRRRDRHVQVSRPELQRALGGGLLGAVHHRAHRVVGGVRGA